MLIDKRWDDLDNTQWSSLANAWLAEIENDRQSGESDVAARVTYMMFSAQPEHLWKFILLATGSVASDDQLSCIAAGPVERLLGRYGDDYIQPVEAQAHAAPMFARMLTGVRPYTMTDETWSRVQALRALSANHLSRTRIQRSHDRSIELEERHLQMLKEALQQRKEQS